MTLRFPVHELRQHCIAWTLWPGTRTRRHLFPNPYFLGAWLIACSRSRDWPQLSDCFDRMNREFIAVLPCR